MRRVWYIRIGALMFGLGIGGGIIAGVTNFGVAMFIGASVVWIIGELKGKKVGGKG